jgi:hypothetical protein
VIVGIFCQILMHFSIAWRQSEVAYAARLPFMKASDGRVLPHPHLNRHPIILAQQAYLGKVSAGNLSDAQYA